MFTCFIYSNARKLIKIHKRNGNNIYVCDSIPSEMFVLNAIIRVHI